MTLSGAGQTQKRQAVSVLRIAIDYDLLESKGLRSPALLIELRKRSERYDTQVLEALATLRDRSNAAPSARWVPPNELNVGMVFAEDVRSKTCILLAARGFEVTEGFIERVRNLRPGSVPERVYIY
ncbi:MAG TPA: hypothetical protein VFN67_09355 [Polyangiales bacterium]|nr:hypothetical protein [Polyangiales bacterium]